LTTALRGGYHLVGGGLAAGDRTAAAEALPRHGPPAGDAAPHAPPAAGQCEGAGPGTVGMRLPDDPLARGNEPDAEQSFRRRAGASRRRQCRSRPPAARTVAADRMAGRRSRAAEVLPVEPAGRHRAQRSGGHRTHSWPNASPPRQRP